MFQDKKRLIGGMNRDVNIKNVPPNDYIYSLNCSNSKDEYIGTIVNIKGNTVVSFTLPEGYNKVIGTCPDETNNTLYYFLYNRNNHHAILRYNIDNNTIDKIVWDNEYLNFNILFPITANKIYDLLSWSDDYSPPSEINVLRAYNFTNNIFVPNIDKYLLITRQELDAIKYPPISQPIVAYSTDNNIQTNNIKGALWQFCYRYVYIDNNKSVVSPFSKVELPQKDELANGSNTENISNNLLIITLNTGPHQVKKIEIFGRGNRMSVTEDIVSVPIEVNNSVWYFIKAIDLFNEEGNRIISYNNNYDYKFYNDVYGEVADASDIYRPYDYLPLKAKYQTIFSEGTIKAYENYTEGFDQTDILVSLAQDTHIKEIQKSVSTIYFNRALHEYDHLDPDRVIALDGGLYVYTHYYFEKDNRYLIQTCLGENATLDGSTSEKIRGDVFFYDNFYLQLTSVPEVGTVINFRFRSLIAPNSSYYYTVKQDDTIDDIYNALFNSISYDNNNYASEEGHMDYVMQGELLNWDGIKVLYVSLRVNIERLGEHPSSQTDRPIMQYLPVLEKYTGFKLGATYKFGIVYYNSANQSSSVNISDYSTKYIKSLNEYYDTPFQLHGVPETFINWWIYHLPPLYATHYQWVYTKQLTMQKYFQFFIEKIEVDANSANNLVISLNDAILNIKKASYKSILSTYVWQKGDRIKFITGETFYTPNINLFFTGNVPCVYIEKEIIGVNDNNDPIIEDFDYNYYHIGQYSLIEIYSPAKELNNVIYYEMGEKFDIGNAGQNNRYHKGGTQDQSPISPLDIPAKGVFKRGDTFTRCRYTADGNMPLIPIEAQNYSDYYFSSGYDIGRVNIYDKDVKQRQYKTSIRFGGRILQNTKINNIDVFKANDYIELSQQYGDISGAYQIGDRMHVLQELKCSSILIGKRELYNADLSTQIVTSDTVLGTIMPNIVDYGCANNLTIAKNMHNIYFFDINKGVPCRFSTNGVQNISYGLEAYFNAKAKYIRDVISNGGVIYTFGYYDNKNKKYVLVFQDIEAQQQQQLVIKRMEALAFNEPTNRWETQFYYKYEEIQSLVDIIDNVNNNIISFVNGALYVHETNPLMNNFWGEQQPMEIMFLCNISPDEMKLLQNIELITNKNVWEVEVIIPPNSMYPIGMHSKLLPANFVGKEGKYSAAFLKDENTPNVDYPIFNGRDLRGEAIIIKLSNKSNELITLFEINLVLNKS